MACTTNPTSPAGFRTCRWTGRRGPTASSTAPATPRRVQPTHRRSCSWPISRPAKARSSCARCYASTLPAGRSAAATKLTADGVAYHPYQFSSSPNTREMASYQIGIGRIDEISTVLDQARAAGRLSTPSGVTPAAVPGRVRILQPRHRGHAAQAQPARRGSCDMAQAGLPTGVRRAGRQADIPVRVVRDPPTVVRDLGHEHHRRLRPTGRRLPRPTRLDPDQPAMHRRLRCRTRPPAPTPITGSAAGRLPDDPTGRRGVRHRARRRKAARMTLAVGPAAVRRAAVGPAAVRRAAVGPAAVRRAAVGPAAVRRAAVGPAAVVGPAVAVGPEAAPAHDGSLRACISKCLPGAVKRRFASAGCASRCAAPRLA